MPQEPQVPNEMRQKRNNPAKIRIRTAMRVNPQQSKREILVIRRAIRAGRLAVCLRAAPLYLPPNPTPLPRWRNWQTHQLEVLAGVKSLGGSSPLLGIPAFSHVVVTSSVCSQTPASTGVFSSSSVLGCESVRGFAAISAPDCSAFCSAPAALGRPPIAAAKCSSVTCM